MLKQMTPLQQRLIVSGAGTLLVLIAIFLSAYSIFKPIFTFAIATVILIALSELYQIGNNKGLKPAKNLGMVLSLSYIFAVSISTQYPIAHLLPDAMLLIMLLSCFLYYFIEGNSPFLNISITIFGIIYLAIPLSCMLRIAYFFSESQFQDGRWWLLYLLAVTKMTDIGGFFIGKKFGKYQLAPYISPKKTWEGAFAGLVSALGISIILGIIGQTLNENGFLLTFWQSIWLGALISIAAQIGDLAESLLKRDGGIKDSSHLPGLGGMLDIVDSLVFTAPILYFFLIICQGKGFPN